jgi:twinkle protein
VTAEVRRIPIQLPDDLAARTHALYDRGLPRGDKTGWTGLDQLFSVAQSQLTVVTGMPSSGKSEWLDALCMNLAEDHDWHFAVYSPENFPSEIHMAKLAEKHVRKPFGAGPNERMTKEELDGAMNWICDKWVWLDPIAKDWQSLLGAAAAFGNARKGRKFGVILDPWNQLEHKRPPAMSETEYISSELTRMMNWARLHQAHIFLVAHPRILRREKDGDKAVPVPGPYDISGSAHWYNKPDNVITVHRDQLRDTQEVEIYVWKVRFKHIGKIGNTKLMYDRVTGRYHDQLPW